jgi:hypothetical protein
MYAAFEIINTSCHTRHIKLPESNKVLMIHDSVNKGNGSFLKYSKYGASTLLQLLGACRAHNQWKQVSKQELASETHISAIGYHDILQDFDFNIYLKSFSGVLP